MSLLNRFIRIGWKILSRRKKLSAFVSSLYASAAYLGSLPGYYRLLRQDKDHSGTHRARGVNIAGYLTMESGVGEAARSLVRAIDKVGIPYALKNIEDPLIQSQNKTYEHIFRNDFLYDINILCFNADQIPSLSRRLPAGWSSGSYSIGYWVWELETFPKIWDPSFRCLQEIWAPSSFCTDAIRTRSPLPVTTIPYAIEIASIDAKRTRESFGLNKDSYLFLFIFSLQSSFERKNPLAILRAFRKAFSGSSMEKVSLVLKLSGSASHRWAYEEIVKASEGLPVRLIDSYLDINALYRLMQLADCYVSLHRSEGFGLTIAESMFLGKPCIATAYSGNMEFMNQTNSFPVNFSMKRIEKSIGPYKRGRYWADADINHAADLMRYMYENREKAMEVGLQGSRSIKEHLSPNAIAAVMHRRISEIRGEQRF